MNCTTCDRVNAPDRNYCGACGAPLMRFCSVCGFRNLASDRFCGGCGAALAEGASRPTAGEAAGAAEPRPAAAAAATPPAADELSELLAAAREADEPSGPEGEVRVNQDDIDSLFGD